MDGSRSASDDRGRDRGWLDADNDGSTYEGPGDIQDRTEAVANDIDHRAIGSYSNDNTAAGRGSPLPPAGDNENVVYVESRGTIAGSAAESVGQTSEAGFGAANERPGTTGTVRTGGTVDAGETIAVPVHEEELSATKTAHRTGGVRIEKDVVAEERVLEVPVTEERVRVQRRAVDRPADGADAAAFREGTIEVPVYGEDVQLQKSVRVAEEVEIAKEAVQTTERVAGTVRREEVRIEDALDADNRGASGFGGTA